MGRNVVQALYQKLTKYLKGGNNMTRIYLSGNNQHQRTVYLDLNHRLITPWEVNPDAQGTDEIFCKVAGQMAWRLDGEFDDGVSTYCSECMELFDPAEVCPQIIVQGRDKGIKLVTLVR